MNFANGQYMNLLYLYSINLLFDYIRNDLIFMSMKSLHFFEHASLLLVILRNCVKYLSIVESLSGYKEMRWVGEVQSYLSLVS